MTFTQNQPTIGQRFTFGGMGGLTTLTLTSIEHGTEHGAPVIYITGINGLGDEVGPYYISA